MIGESFGEWLQTFPQWIMDAFAVIGGIMPALGIGMLLNYLGKKKILPFFFAGFFLTQFLGLSTMAITAFGVIIAFILYNFKSTAKVGV
jgi:mannose/fructose/N-acetylgalactosamine-specific phosphotransferase system component IIC